MPIVAWAKSEFNGSRHTCGAGRKAAADCESACTVCARQGRPITNRPQLSKLPHKGSVNIRSLMKTFVTGGASCIGSDLAAELLSRGEEGVVVDNVSSGKLRHIDPHHR